MSYSMNESISSSMNTTFDLTISRLNMSDLGLECLRTMGYRGLTQFGLLFYIHNPYDHIFENVNEVRNYEIWVTPALAILVILEQIIRFFQRKQTSRVADMVINIGSAMLYALLRVFLLGLVVTLFVYIYKHYRLVTLPIDSLWTWVLSILLVEFCYYWTHRAFHEINILWATHQYHHMAEDLSVTTAIRNSIVDLIFFDIFPIPLAVIIPPPILAVHIQFSLLCQLWIHNEVIPQLGPLEYVVNTAGNHRVHHGKNPYCIDKNYSALLMFWDHIFGTYQHEKDHIIFGVVSKHPETYNMLTLQFGYYKNVFQKFQSVDGWKNKLSALVKGPGWQPGTPRLGLLSEVPEPDPNLPKYTYDPFIPLWHKMYTIAHAFIIFLGFYLIADHQLVRNSWFQIFLGMAYITYSLVSFGALYDKRPYAPTLEVFRCLFYLAIDFYVISANEWKLTTSERILVTNFIWTVRAFHISCILLWISRYVFYHESVYIVHKTVDNIYNDIEKIELKQLGTKWTIVFLFMGLTIMGFILLVSYALQVEQCSQMLDRIVANTTLL